METLFKVRRNSNNESVGEKMLRGRRNVSYSPYARPDAAASSSAPSAENTVKSNWFSGFFVPASRMIVNGAGKIVSTVFGSKDSLTSSDENEDEDNDSINEGDSDDNNGHNSQGSDGINQNAIESYGTKYLEKQPLAVVQRSETKLQIERLLMQEAFSRDECNRLTKIIQSRVVECHASREGGNASQGAARFGEEARNSSSYLGNGVDSLSSGPLAHHHAAIIEAKKWLEEKKSASQKLENSPLALTASPFEYPNVTEGKVGSPVLMAKTYMRSRPPWASPSSSHVGFRTPSPIRMHLVKEETPIGARSVSPSKFIRRNPLANDSQEILAELRRVRLKSEEAMLLSSHSSIHIQPSAPESGHKDGHTASRDGEQYAELGATHDSDLELTTKSIDSATMMMENDGLVIETTSSVPAVILLNKDQDSEDPRFKESVEETSQVNNTSEVMETDYSDDSRWAGGLNPSKEINETTERVTSNGAPPSTSSLSAGLNVGPENEGSSEGKLGIGLIPLEEETCEPLSEAAVQIPDDGDEEIYSGAIGLETSSGEHLIEIEPISRKSNSTLVGKQPQEKKIGKSSRRGRGIGKSRA